jgi:hypothetical protein
VNGKNYRLACYYFPELSPTLTTAFSERGAQGGELTDLQYQGFPRLAALLPPRVLSMSGSPNQGNALPSASSLVGATSLPPEPNSLLPELENFLAVTAEQYESCLGHVDHDYIVDGASATMRLHYVRFDANGRPKFKELAEVLTNHLGHYAIMAQRHAAAKTHIEHVRIHREAKKLLRRYAKSGEPGELLLYFLMEAVLKAPQAISKISLKTNRKEEVKGSDGMHLRWDAARGRLILYFGEAKLYKSISSAMTAALKSIEEFHSEGAEEHEVFLASNHFKLLGDRLKSQVCAFLDRTSSKDGYELQHACLVGFDWDQYGDLDNPRKRKGFVADFDRSYLLHAGKIHTALEGRLKRFKYNHLIFEFFFIPFKSVQEFRDWFLEEVFGEASK